MNKKKIVLVIVLFSVAATIFGSFVFGGNDAKMKSANSKTEAEAVKFCREIMQLVQEKNAREFIRKSLDPKDRSLRAYFLEMQHYSEPENVQWLVEMNPKQPDVYYVRMTDGKKDILLMVIERKDGELKFAGVPLG